MNGKIEDGKQIKNPIMMTMMIIEISSCCVKLYSFDEMMRKIHNLEKR